MLGKTAVVSLLIVCITALVRDSLCELQVRQGNTEIQVFLAYEAKE